MHCADTQTSFVPGERTELCRERSFEGLSEAFGLKASFEVSGRLADLALRMRGACGGMHNAPRKIVQRDQGQGNWRCRLHLKGIANPFAEVSVIDDIAFSTVQFDVGPRGTVNVPKNHKRVEFRNVALGGRVSVVPFAWCAGGERNSKTK